MLSRELMGLLALGILWVNAALVLAVALRQLSNVLALRRRLAGLRARGELVSGTVERCEGERLAVRRVTQRGRAITTKGPERILFTDGPQSFEVLGGVVKGDAGSIEIRAAPPAASEVWVDEERARDCVACPDAAGFDAAWRPASTFEGFAREVELEVRARDRVWVAGAREGDRIGPSEDGPLLISMVDPFAFCASRVRLLAGFLVGATLGLVGVTALALWPPPFGLVSTIGGVLCVAYFLAIQPLGTAIRDAVKTPGRRALGGQWRRSDAARAGAPSA